MPENTFSYQFEFGLSRRNCLYSSAASFIFGVISRSELIADAFPRDSPEINQRTGILIPIFVPNVRLDQSRKTVDTRTRVGYQH